MDWGRTGAVASSVSIETELGGAESSESIETAVVSVEPVPIARVSSRWRWTGDVASIESIETEVVGAASSESIKTEVVSVEPSADHSSLESEAMDWSRSVK